MVINFSEEKRLRKIKGLQQLGQYIVILGLFLISATIFAHAEDEDIHDSPSSFLWQIEYAGKEVGALLGTVHIGTKESEISDQAMALIDQSRDLITEIQIVFPSLQEEQRIYAQAVFSAFKLETRAIEERFTPEYAERVRDALRKQRIILLAQQDQLSDEFILMMLMLDIGQGYHADFGMEKLLRTYIKDTDVNNRGLEAITESLELYVEASKPFSKMMIEAWLDNQELLQGLNKELIHHYENNDIIGFTEIMNHTKEISFHGDENEADLEHYYNVLLFDRNRAWLETLTPILKENADNGKFDFIAVGAFHLLGDQGLIALLKQEGFELTPVFDEGLTQ